MGFLAPFMLWGAAAAAVPIALHFFFRSRYRRVPWAAMKFLLTSIEQTSRRLKFQELLLLFVRVAVLVLLALALARPIGSTGPPGGAGEAVDAALVIDTSYSMDAREGGITRLTQAKQAARDIIDHLPPHSTVRIITCTDRATLLGPPAPADLDRAKELVDGIGLSHLATDFLPGIEAAAQALGNGQSAHKELYLLSDMQKLGWDSRPQEVRQALADLHERARIYLIRCGQDTPRNAAVIGIVPQSGIPHTGERAGFAVLVRNSGPHALRNLNVSLTVDGKADQRETQPISELAPGQTQAVTVTAKLTRPGLRVLSATLGPDELEADNRYDEVIRVRDQVRILVVDGGLNQQEPEKSASFFLMHALLPVKDEDKPGYYIQPRLVSPRQAALSLLAGRDLCILVNVNLKPNAGDELARLPRGFLDGLSAFVRSGHGLIIFGGDHVAVDPYNQLLLRQQGLLPVALRSIVAKGDQQPVRIDRNSSDSPVFAVLRDDESYKGLNGIDVRRYLDTDDPPRSASSGGAIRVLLRYSDGRPAIVSRRVEAGEVMLVTTSADLSWTDWALWHGMYLPTVNLALNHLLRGQTQQHNISAGAPLRWRPEDRDAGQSFVCIHPDGERERLGVPESVAGRPLVSTAQTGQAGVYRVAFAPGRGSVTPVADVPAEERTGVPFAVVPDLHESEDLECLSDGAIDTRLGFQPVHLAAGADVASVVGTARFNREWTLWLLAGVLALLLVESGLAWLCGRAL